MQGSVAFDAEHLHPHAAEHRGLIAAAGTDLQHLVARPNAQQLRLERHGVRLGDGLAARDREGLVLIGLTQERTVVDELVPGHGGDRFQHGGIGDAFRLQLFH